MFEDDLTIVDVEHAILTGQIIERQRDALTREANYLLRGSTPWREIDVAVAFAASGRLNIITVFAVKD